MIRVRYGKLKVDTSAAGKTTLKKYGQYLGQVRKRLLTVGIHAGPGRRKISRGFSVLQNAYQQEFGTSYTVKKTRRFKKNGKQYFLKKGTHVTIPARPFVRSFLFSAKKRDRLQRHMATLFNKFPQINKANTFWNSVGWFARREILKTIASNEGQANAAMTRDYKGHSNPLVYTGTMGRAVNYRIRTANAYIKDLLGGRV